MIRSLHAEYRCYSSFPHKIHVKSKQWDVQTTIEMTYAGNRLLVYDFASGMHVRESRDSLFTRLWAPGSPAFLMKDKHNQSHRDRKREYYIGWPCNFVAASGARFARAPQALLFSFHYTMLHRVIIVLIIRSKGHGLPPRWIRVIGRESFIRLSRIFPTGSKATTAVSCTIAHMTNSNYRYRVSHFAIHLYITLCRNDYRC